MSGSRYDFIPEQYEQELTAIIGELLEEPKLDADAIARAVKRHPKNGCKTFSKSEIIRGFRHFAGARGWDAKEPRFVERLKAKPIRTESGVAPVTVLTKPFPCPGECIFCPNDVRMPKSYLSMEPGAQRAAQHGFDPYGQTFTRLRAFHNNGHRIDKVELIILGGTWSNYPEEYQIWFIKRCLDAMNDFFVSPQPYSKGDDFAALSETIDGRKFERNYNLVVLEYLKRTEQPREAATWEELEAAQLKNENGACRCVGLVVETRPDRLDEAEVIRIRRLGATKVQIGYQSLSDEVLAQNKRGHDVATTRRAMALLRLAGFKVHAHWMPNLLGSDARADVEDFQRIFNDRDFRPDELKIYPCSLIESAELMKYWEAGAWRPYEHEELVDVLVDCMARVPRWCRLTRIIRDIPSHDILVGNKSTNLREVAEGEATRRGLKLANIRAREIRGAMFDASTLATIETEYETGVGREVFLEVIAPEDRIVAFLRLSLPSRPSFIEEIATSAMIREVHVYGAVASIGERDPEKPQHLGLGKKLIDRATAIAAASGYDDLAVISSIGTRRYYADLGFSPGPLYQHRATHDFRSQADELLQHDSCDLFTR
jgi:elongator complex protein 3